MTDQEDIVYCNAEQCKAQSRIVQNLNDLLQNHGDHFCQEHIRKFSELQKDLQDDTHPLKWIKVDTQRENIISFIDEGMAKMKKEFDNQIKVAGDNLKEFVKSHLMSIVDTYELYNIVVQNKTDQFIELQNNIPLLFVSSDILLKQKNISRQVMETIEIEISRMQTKMVNIFEQIPLKMFEEWKWSTQKKAKTIQIDSQTASSISGINCAKTIFLEPSMTMNDVRSVKLQMKRSNNSVDVQLVDWSIRENKKNSNANDNLIEYGGQSHFGTYAVRVDQAIYHIPPSSVPPYTNPFFYTGDILKLEWNGPQRKYTVTNLSTNTSYQFDVSFSKDAVIYFGVYLYDGESSATIIY